MDLKSPPPAPKSSTNGRARIGESTPSALDPKRATETKTPPTPPRAKTEKKNTPAAKLDKAIDSLNEVANRLAAIMAQPHPPIAAIGSPAAPRNVDNVDYGHLADKVGQEQAHRRLKKELLNNGDHAYSLPTDSIRAGLADLVGQPREAFVHCRPGSDKSHVKLVGTSDAAIEAAMQFAKRAWGDDGVIIHMGDKNRDKIIEHAVKVGLNIENRDPEIQALVAKERERQNNSLVQNLTARDLDQHPLIEHVPAQGQKRAS